MVKIGKGTILPAVSAPGMGRFHPGWGGHAAHTVLVVLLVWFSWLLCSVVAALLGARKNAGRSAFYTGMLLGPLGILVALMRKGDPERCPRGEQGALDGRCGKSASKLR